MADFGQRAERGDGDTCYRHPDRRSFVLCQRCARTVCGDCQSPAPVGVLCPECVAAARRAAAATRPGFGRRLQLAATGGRPVVAYAVIALTAVVYALQFVTGGFVTDVLLYNSIFMVPNGPAFEPWRAFTATLVHGGLWHVAFNLLTLWLFARVLEPLYGSLRFALVWVAAALGGSLAVTVGTPYGSVIGASGAVFGLFGAYFVVMRQARMNTTSLLVLIGINVVLGFVVPGIAWEAHLGGLVTGLLAGWLVSGDLRAPRVTAAGAGAPARSRRRTTGAVLVGALAALLLAVNVLWAATVMPQPGFAGGTHAGTHALPASVAEAGAGAGAGAEVTGVDPRSASPRAALR